ncbi:MAG: NAD(P)/FAD-dependent oxidoreductase [Bacteroidota bacterium]
MPKTTHPNIIIIGGGAAGFFAAINCAQLNPKARITILERGKSVLGKVKISGGGRCNLTHAIWTPRELVKNYPRGAKALMGPFSKFCTGDTVDWFEKRGVETKIEEDGRMFPISDSSQSIIDCLWLGAKKAGVQVYTSTRVDNIVPPKEVGHSWKIIVKDNETLYADKVMMATGSSPKMWNMLAKLGHHIIPPVPSLFTFNIRDGRIKDLLGISMSKVEVKILGIELPKNERTAVGPLLITHWGMSGPAILKLSAVAARALHAKNYHFEILVNWRADLSAQDVTDDLNHIIQSNPKKVVRSNPQFDFPARLWQRLVTAAGIPDDRRFGELSKKMKNKLIVEITQGSYQVTGKSTFKDEFVTAGGVDLDEIDFQRFESKIHPNLFFAGEVLDIDAVTGGFNFQAAWTGGYLAAKAIADV